MKERTRVEAGPVRLRIGSIVLGLAVLFFCADGAVGQSNQREPSIGYLYPAGGQTGTRVQILIGGQNLRGVSRVCVSGEGAEASLVRYMGRFRRLNGTERRELRRRLDALNRSPGGTQPVEGARGGLRKELAKKRAKKGEAERAAAADPVKLPNHPLLNELDNLSPWELEFVENQFLRLNRKNQPNAQIADTALIEVVIEPGAIPGDRELRLETATGMTNPLCFQIGRIPEQTEPEPYDSDAPPTDPVDLPMVMNGQIKAGDIDRFRFHASEGQDLVIATCARHLIPFLADAVPGWFQATLALFDESGNELAFTDDYRFSPDPIMFYRVPATGIYELEIRDSIYRGRADFVYRVSIDEQPFITSIFPLGGREGEKTTAKIGGWNLRRKKLGLDTRPNGGSVRQVALHQDDQLSNPVLFAVDDLPESTEVEPNSSRDDAQPIDLPRIVNGRIAAPGDVDFFRFRGRAKQELVVEVIGRRLHSPIDSVIKLIDPSGQILAWNDDHEYKNGFLHNEMGTLTHHADSYLRHRLRRGGKYCIQIGDSRNHGGDAFAYRLRLGPPRPGFELRVTPSSLAMRTGRTAPICVHASRKDGFEGAIEVRLKNAPPGFDLQGGLIPAGVDRIRATLTAPPRPLDEPVSIRIEGQASIDGQPVSRPAIPADNRMQAFLYRHLVPSQDFLVTVRGSRVRFPSPVLALDGPVRIKAGGTARVRVNLAKKARMADFELQLNEPPAGVSIQDWTLQPGGLDFVVKADAETALAGAAGNLIVEVFTFRERRSRGADEKPQKQRQLIGVLPAIPFEIVKR